MIVHRLTATLAFFLHLSPYYETLLGPLLEVLQARDVLKSKLSKGGCGEAGVDKKEVRNLVEEVAQKLCP
jgi:desumoylating isopeptidase 1